MVLLIFFQFHLFVDFHEFDLIRLIPIQDLNFPVSPHCLVACNFSNIAKTELIMKWSKFDLFDLVWHIIWRIDWLVSRRRGLNHTYLPTKFLWKLQPIERQPESVTAATSKFYKVVICYPVNLQGSKMHSVLLYLLRLPR